MSLNAALKGTQSGPARRRVISKQQKRIETRYFEVFEEKGIPFQKEEQEVSPDGDPADDLDWFLGPGNGASSSSSSSQKWQRLHHGLKPRQSLDEVQTPSDVAARRSGLYSMVQPLLPQSTQRQSLKQLLQQDITPSETVLAEPLKPIQPRTFPPMNTRPEKAAKPKQSHYQFFASLGTSEDADRRKFVEQKTVWAGKKLNATWPSLGSFHRQASRLFNNESQKTILGRGAGKLGNSENLHDLIGANHDRSCSKDPMTTKTFLKRSSSKEVQRLGNADASRSKTGLSGAKKTSCRALRLCILGRIGDEQAQNQKEADLIFDEPRGTYQDVVRFYQAWKELDADFSGEVTFRELLDFGRWRGLTPLQERALKAVLNTDAIDERYKVIQMYQLMTVLWPKSEIEDRVWMNEIIDQLAMEGGDKQDTELEPLPEELMAEFKAEFTEIQSGSGQVNIKDLIGSGLITEEKAMESLRSLVHLGIDEDSNFGFQEFVLIMCPKGYVVPKADPTA